MITQHRFLTKKTRVLCRKLIGRVSNRTPFEVIDNSMKPPRLCGHKYHYETEDGQIVPHTNMKNPDINYARLIYRPSTLVIAVGELWLREQIDAT